MHTFNNAAIGALGTAISTLIKNGGNGEINEETLGILFSFIIVSITIWAYMQILTNIILYIIKRYKKHKAKKCNNKYKENNKICKNCKYKEECKNGF